MGASEPNGPVSLGRGTVVHDTGKAIKVELEGKAAPTWVPSWAVHADSEIWKVGQEPGELVVVRRFAEDTGLVEDAEPTPSSPSARTLAKRGKPTLADEIRDLTFEVKALGSDVAALRFILVKLADAWDVKVFEE